VKTTPPLPSSTPYAKVAIHDFICGSETQGHGGRFSINMETTAQGGGKHSHRGTDGGVGLRCRYCSWSTVLHADCFACEYADICIIINNTKGIRDAVEASIVRVFASMNQFSKNF
jgi:hypothetical protein